MKILLLVFAAMSTLSGCSTLTNLTPPGKQQAQIIEESQTLSELRA
jgi:uncharacterized protein YceK